MTKKDRLAIAKKIVDEFNNSNYFWDWVSEFINDESRDILKDIPADERIKIRLHVRNKGFFVLKKYE